MLSFCLSPLVFITRDRIYRLVNFENEHIWTIPLVCYFSELNFSFLAIVFLTTIPDSCQKMAPKMEAICPADLARSDFSRIKSKPFSARLLFEGTLVALVPFFNHFGSFRIHFGTLWLSFNTLWAPL